MRARKQLDRRAAKRGDWRHPERGVPWTKGVGHRRSQCVHPGAATRGKCARGTNLPQGIMIWSSAPILFLQPQIKDNHHQSGQAHETPG